MLLNDYYNDIIQAVKLCVEMIVPKRQLVNTGFNVPGWNDFKRNMRLLELPFWSGQLVANPDLVVCLSACLGAGPALNLLSDTADSMKMK